MTTRSAQLIKKRHYTIPIFIPEKACPFRCVYCNQYHIADREKQPEPDEIDAIVQQYLATFPKDGVKRVAFFGGSFTGMSIEDQNRYLDKIQPYIRQGDIESIQLSTRPDYIDTKILENLSRKSVRIIELGAQSLDDAVLRSANRGHNAEMVRQAAQLIKNYGFELGLQMMIGLPGDTFEKSMTTAQIIVSLGADYTRIYPTLVIKDTDLEKLYLSGNYTPLSWKEAINRSKSLLLFFENHNVTILRIGLHPTEGLRDGSTLLAGPFHPSFKELVMSSLWRDILQDALNEKSGETLTVYVHPKAINMAIGHASENRKWLEKRFKNVRFLQDENLERYQLRWEL